MATDIQGLAANGTTGVSMGLIAEITSGKEPMLRSPGVLRPGDDLYYTKENSMVQLPELRVKTGTDEISAQNKYMGSQTSFILPSERFIYGPVFAQFVIPEGNSNNYDGGNPDEILMVPHGWGFNCIESIEYTLGRTSATNLSISGYGNFMAAMIYSPNEETREIIMKSAGREYAVNSTVTENPFEDNGLKVYAVDKGMRTAIVPIHIPFSVIKQKIPFDASTLDTPIKITIRTKNVSDWWSGYTNRIKNPQFEEMNLVYKSAELSNKSLGLGELVKNNSLGRWLGYPYQVHTEDEITTQVSLVNAGQNPISPIKVDLKNFINGDLTAIAVMFIRDIDHGTSIDQKKRVVTPALNFADWGTSLQLRKQSCLGIPVRDLKIFLNNNRLAVYDLANSNEMFNTSIYDGSYRGPNVQVMKNVINSVALGGKGAQTGISFKDIVTGDNTSSFQSHIYTHFFTPKNCFEDEGEMQNTLRFPQNQMRLEFSIPQELGLGTADLSAEGNGTYKMHFPNQVESTSTPSETIHIKVIQFYNGVWTIENGATKLYT